MIVSLQILMSVMRGLINAIKTVSTAMDLTLAPVEVATDYLPMATLV